ncbi:MAG: hypothetical protein ACJA2X_002436 [Halocynthiibacter sp.]|jgi:hypothetical protein
MSQQQERSLTMNRTHIVCYLIAVSQIALGGLYLFWPAGFIDWQGLGPISGDIGYPLAMLAGRFFIYGLGMIAIARQPEKYSVWLDGMIGIQLIDLLAGAFYVSAGIVVFTDAIVPMFNASMFIVLMVWVRPTDTKRVPSMS